MSFIHNAVSFAFPFIEGTDPMILAPVLAMVLSFALVGMFGLAMAAHDFVTTKK
jgi:hypothetical protein